MSIYQDFYTKSNCWLKASYFSIKMKMYNRMIWRKIWLAYVQISLLHTDLYNNDFILHSYTFSPFIGQALGQQQICIYQHQSQAPCHLDFLNGFLSVNLNICLVQITFLVFSLFFSNSSHTVT